MPNTQETNKQQNAEPVSPEVQAYAPTPAAAKTDNAPVYAVLKAYFFTPKRGDIWGAFCFLFNGSTGDGMESVFWVTRAMVGPAIDVTARWRDLTKSIPAMGPYEKNLSEKLKETLMEMFTSSARISLVESPNTEEQTLALGEDLRNAFERTTHYFLEFKIKLEKLTTQNLLDAGVLASDEGASHEKSASGDSEKTRNFDGTIVNCLPIVDPVHGKPVSELSPGDMLDVKLEEGAGAGNLVQKYLESTSQDSVFPVESIERTDGEKTYIFLTISDEIRGLITVTKDLRLRVFSPESSGILNNLSFNIDADNLIFISTVLISAVVIGFIIRLLLHSM